jgi:Fe-S-cluster containining protein
MPDNHSNSPAMQATVGLTINGRRFDMNISVPPGQLSINQMLPLFRHVAEGFLDVGVADEAAAGREVSCKKGCGACCRQLVPISAIEATEVAGVVDRMPEERKKVILERFADARRRLEEVGMLEPLLHPDQFSDEHMRNLGREYFKFGIPCPFLEEESCSIYLDRPITCREYLVTSPAENCAAPTPETIKMVPLPAGRVWTSVARLEQQQGSRFIRWVPLIVALDFAGRDQPQTPRRTGREWTEEFFRRLA